MKATAPGIEVVREIPVEIKTAKSWSIIIGAGIVGNLSRLFDFEPYSAIILMCDGETNRLYGRQVSQVLTATGKEVPVLTVPVGEGSKSLREVEGAYQFLLEHNIDRRGLLCILGGGVAGDLGGYIAATYLRGIDYIQLPTTLLAQVDSGIGGKVGVNFAGKKNIIGSFYQPKAIISDVSFLESLPIGEMRNGLAEVIKYGVALDRDLFRHLSRKGEMKFTAAELVDLVERCSRLKIGVVKADETERSGRRAILNFGHTVGHAVEASGGLVGRHGEAIAIGMTAAARISERVALLNKRSVQQIERLLTCFGLPTRCPGMDPKALIEAIRFDKKVADGQVRWVLLDRVGHGVVNCQVAEDVVREVLEEMCR